MPVIAGRMTFIMLIMTLFALGFSSLAATPSHKSLRLKSYSDTNCESLIASSCGHTP